MRSGTRPPNRGKLSSRADKEFFTWRKRQPYRCVKQGFDHKILGILLVDGTIRRGMAIPRQGSWTRRLRDDRRNARTLAALFPLPILVNLPYNPLTRG